MGSIGSLVELMQLALLRAGFSPGTIDGIFGTQTSFALQSFQRAAGLAPDAIAGPRTHAALDPYYTGYTTHTVSWGETLFLLSMKYGTEINAIGTANPDLDPLNLQIGQKLIIPLPFEVVPTNISYSSSLIAFCCRGLTARYPFIDVLSIGESVMGKPIFCLTVGSGENHVFYNASHHANEWITTPVLLHFLENLSNAYALDDTICHLSAKQLLTQCTLCIVPAVNPDGIDLVTGALNRGKFFEGAIAISENYPDIPFPEGWKANIIGTDLNLQYPAGWERARENKYAQCVFSPAPRDFVGPSALFAPESLAVFDFTNTFLPDITLSYHSQGAVIYWKYLDFEPPQSRYIAELFGTCSGYLIEQTPIASGFAGFKDWFIQEFNKPGYTIEVGLGENPLPISQFDEIYSDNLGILTYGLAFTAED